MTVEGDVVGVAEPGGHRLDPGAVAIHATDPAAGREQPHRVAAGVPHPRQQLVLVPDWRHQRAGSLGHPRVVPGDQIKKPIGTEGDAVGTVFPAFVERHQAGPVVVGSVPVQVADPVEPRPVGPPPRDHAVQVILDAEQALGGPHRQVDRLDDARGRIGPGRARRDAEQTSGLIARQQPAAGIHGQAHPRALRCGHLVHHLDHEPRRHLQAAIQRRAADAGEFTPGLLAVLRDLDRGAIHHLPALFSDPPRRIGDHAVPCSVLPREPDHAQQAGGAGVVAGLDLDRERSGVGREKIG